jgi:tetratricopeptide (TPR) repeat protein
MSRFNNLEFDGHFEDQSHLQHARKAFKDGSFYLTEAQSEFEHGRFERALRAYSKVLEFDPKCATAWAGQVRMLVELGEIQEAKLWADKALDMFPEEAELLAAKAVVLARAGDFKAAMIFSDSAVEAKSTLPYVWVARGDVFLARKEKRAEYCFERAVSLAPHDSFLRWLISRIYLFYKQFSRALKLAQQAVELDAGRAALWLQFGRCQMALGLTVPAGNSFEQARQLDPECHLGESEALALREDGFWMKLRGHWRKFFGK